MRWDAPGDAHWVEFGIGGLDDKTEESPTSEALLRLHEGAWVIRAVSLDDDGRRRTQTSSLVVPEQPELLGRFEVLVSEPEAELRDLLLFFNQYSMEPRFSWVAVIDGTGRHRWYLPGDPPPFKINRAHVGPDGQPWFTTYHWDREADWGTLHQVSWDGLYRERWSLPEQHHDFVVEDDSVTWLSWVYRDTPMPGTTSPVATDALRSRRLDGDQPSILWSVLDDHPLDLLPPCPHASAPKFKPGFTEFSHGNSVVSVDDEWWVMLRYLDQIVAVDKQTGATKWSLGGPEATLSYDGVPPSHPHFSDAWADGLLVFDNGDHRPDDTSSAIEYVLDGEVAREVWRFEHPEGTHTPFLGDVRRLPGGNRLVVWSSSGELMEVTPDGRVVWHAVTPDVVGRVTVLDPGWQPVF